VDMAHDFAQGPELLRFVINDEIILIAQTVDIEPQDAHAERVKGADSRFRGFLTLFTRRSFGDKLRDTLLHLPSRLVGEGDGQNLLRRHSAFFNEVRYPGSDDMCFARAGTGQNDERAFHVGDCFVLLWVEGGQVHQKIKKVWVGRFSRNGSLEKRFRFCCRCFRG